MPLSPGMIEAGTDIAKDAASGVFGLILGGVNNKRQVKQQRRLNEVNKEMTEWNMKKQMEMWENTGYVGQKDQMKRAGINPALMYGMSGGGGQSSNIQTASGGQASGGGGEVPAMIGLGIERMMAQASIEKMKAETEKVKAETIKTAGIDTELGMMDKIIKEFAGKEARDQYEKVKSPNRGIEAKTYEDEMEARQGIAGTIDELWKEGKLHDKSIAEIEGMLIQNAKGRAERQKIEKEMDLIEQNTKGKSLENIITELEGKLQTETGIDRNSPTWLKVLGRLFVELTK